MTPLSLFDPAPEPEAPASDASPLETAIDFARSRATRKVSEATQAITSVAALATRLGCSLYDTVTALRELRRASSAEWEDMDLFRAANRARGGKHAFGGGSAAHIARRAQAR